MFSFVMIFYLHRFGRVQRNRKIGGRDARDRPSMNFNSNPIKVDSQFQFSMRGKELL
jgi:hypothetical protein